MIITGKHKSAPYCIIYIQHEYDNAMSLGQAPWHIFYVDWEVY